MQANRVKPTVPSQQCIALGSQLTTADEWHAKALALHICISAAVASEWVDRHIQTAIKDHKLDTAKRLESYDSAST